MLWKLEKIAKKCYKNKCISYKVQYLFILNSAHVELHNGLSDWNGFKLVSFRSQPNSMNYIHIVVRFEHICFVYKH